MTAIHNEIQRLKKFAENPAHIQSEIEMLERLSELKAGSVAYMDSVRLRLEAEKLCAKLGVTIEELAKKGRHHTKVLLRQVIMTKLYEMGFGVTAIGRLFDRDHTTVLHAKETYANHYYSKYEKMMAILENLENNE